MSTVKNSLKRKYAAIIIVVRRIFMYRQDPAGKNYANFRNRLSEMHWLLLQLAMKEIE